MLNMVKRLWKEEEGQGMAEYALILVAVAVVVILALTTLGDNIKEKINDIAGYVEDPSTAP